MPESLFVRRADRALRTAVKITAGIADVVRRPAAGVVILLYHRVGAGSSSSVDLPVELFDEQMASLAGSHDVVSLDEALRVLRGERVGPCVAVTFDDGTSDLVDLALPVLVRHRIPATWYLATSFIDEQRPFTGTGKPLSWAAVRDACSTGLVSVGSHTHRHLLLDRASAAQVHDELTRSITSIGDNTGTAPLDFAYPKALLGSGAAQAAVREHFRSAALAGTRANVVGATDPHRLARSPIQVNDGRVWFERKVAGGMAVEATVRELMNRRRYARATT
jgi:peptidoglycan/xylan/chitin deacetylase (PgdA/CDA1 family)